MSSTNKPDPSPQKTADQVAKTFFGVTSETTRQTAIRQMLIGAVECAVLIPALFYLRFDEISGLGWGTTIFFVGYCLLSAIGLYYRPRIEYHTQVRLRGDWADKIGAFWLISCVFGPFLGWLITSAFPITGESWRWLYALRVILAVVLPLLTALPLTRYLRGRATWVALPILVVITLLPIWSAVNVSRDLWEGPVRRQVQATDQQEWYLPYTEQSLSDGREGSE
jgi:hypothetical protein